MMTYNNEEFLLTDEDSFSQQSNNIKTWVFGRDREERSQIISTLKQEQWPIVSIQSLDYFDTLANQLSPDILILCSDIMSTSGNQLIKSIRRWQNISNTMHWQGTSGRLYKRTRRCLRLFTFTIKQKRAHIKSEKTCKIKIQTTTLAGKGQRQAATI